jgi:hypothetical protein
VNLKINIHRTHFEKENNIYNVKKGKCSVTLNCILTLHGMFYVCLEVMEIVVLKHETYAIKIRRLYKIPTFPFKFFYTKKHKWKKSIEEKETRSTTKSRKDPSPTRNQLTK